MDDRQVDGNRFEMSRRTAVRGIGGGAAMIAVAALGLGGATVHPGAAAQSTPAADAEPGLRDAWSAAWSSGSGEQVATVYTEDCVYEDVPSGMVTHGKDELAMFAQGLFDTLADVQQPVESWTATATWAAAQWRVEGTHRETTQPVSFWGASILELANGKIARETAYYDNATFLTQVGGMCEGPELMPMPEGTPGM